MVRLLWCGVLCLIAGCAKRAEGDKLLVVTSFLPAYSLVANVAGENARVENLVPGGGDLHDFQLTPGDLRKIAQADLVVINGLGLESFLDRVIENLGAETRKKVVVMSGGLDERLIKEEGRPDPHTWLDPTLAMQGVTNIWRALEKADPQNAGSYAVRASETVRKLKALDEEIAAEVAPCAEVPFVTFHNAFRYFARRYGLSIAGVVEEVPEVTPSPREMAALHATIRNQKARAIFTQPGEQTRMAEQIAKDAGIKLGELDPLETGDLTPQGYEEGMRKNARELVRVLR